ncbi:MAG: Fic family protein [Candidatus Aenigmarchaeota archaeon]|nr:Fic family protein [Candidatus Aenigmarchaeota archaeon]
MAYIYKKVVEGKTYYYLRASVRKGTRIVAKDISYLGSTLDEVKASLDAIPKSTVRKAYKSIQRFLESNIYLEKAKKLKLKTTSFLDKTLLEEVEACKLHWQHAFKQRDKRTQQELIKRFAVDFTFNTTNIEGNTITLKQAKLLLSEDLTPKNKTLREIYDVQNTQRVFLQLLERVPALAQESIIQTHRELMRNVDPRIGYRTEDVHVIHARFASSPAPYVKTDMSLLIKWCEENACKLYPFVLAGIFHHKFEKIHPFFDGNGRAGRMLLNSILLKNGYPPIIIRKRNRAAYLETLGKADKAHLLQTKPEHYKPLIEFLAAELIQTYWDVFL